jgi:hypothetical protein
MYFGRLYGGKAPLWTSIFSCGRSGRKTLGLSENNLSQQVRALRRKLGQGECGQEYILNATNHGYFVAGIAKLTERTPPEIEPVILLTEPSPEHGEAALPTALLTRQRSPTVIAAVITILLPLFIIAAQTGAYGLAVVVACAGCMLAAVVYRRSNETRLGRAIVALLFAAVMAYIPSATSLAEVVASVINATTLRPAIAYPFITGLKFIPLFVLVLSYWVLLGKDADMAFRTNRILRYIYIALGPTLLLLTGVLLIRSSSDDRVCQEGLPGCRSIAIGYAAVVTINIVIWLVGYREFNKDRVNRHRHLWLACAVAYLPLAFAGFVVDETYNSINAHYLDKRRPEAYFAGNPEAVEELKHAGFGHQNEIGPDLMALLNDPAFERTLRAQYFSLLSGR